MAYSCLNFQRAPEGMSNESYIWDLGEKQRGLVATGKDEGARQRPVKARGEEGRSSGTLVGLVPHWGAQGPRRKPLSHPFAVWVQLQPRGDRSEAGTPFISRSQGIRDQTTWRPSSGSLKSIAERVPSRLRSDPRGPHRDAGTHLYPTCPSTFP